MFKYFLVRLNYFLKNYFLKILQSVFFIEIKEKEKIQHIVIFRNGSLGDSVCSLPAIYNIRKNFPKSNITILYNAGKTNLASIEHVIDKKLVDGFINYIDIPKKNLVKRLKIEKIDLFIELPQVHQPFKSHVRNIIFVRSLGIKHAFGWQIHTTRLFSKTQEKHISFTNVKEYFLSLLEKNGLYVFNRDIYPLGINLETIKKIDTLFKSISLDKFNPPVAFIVGAKRPQNRWPVSYFDHVIEYLTNKNVPCILIGGKEDTNIVRKLKNYDRVTDLTGKLTPLESAEAMKRCRLVVTNDTGPMHLAYAVGTFVFAIFSSRDYPHLWYPPKERSVVFRNHDIHCKTCFSETCKENICMQQIKPEQVISKIDEFLHHKQFQNHMNPDLH